MSSDGEMVITEIRVWTSAGTWTEMAPPALAGAAMVELGLGVRIPAGAKFVVSRPGWPFTLELAIANEYDGVQVAELALRALDGHSLSAADLRDVAIDQVVRSAQANLVRVFSSPDKIMRDAPDKLGHDDRLQRAATMYRMATLMRGNATEAVAEGLRASRATAGRLIRQCREAGLLGPAKRGGASA